MMCWGRSNKSKAETEEDMAEEEEVVTLMPSSSSQQSMHDYIFSPKDFCDSVLQKKLVPELYLNGVVEEMGPLAASQELRRSQGDARKSQGDLRASRNDLRKSTSAGGNDLRKSAGGASVLRSSRSDLRASQGEASDLRVSQGDGTDPAAAGAVPDGDDGSAAPVTPRTAAVNGNVRRFSTFFSNTSYTNINYYEEFCQLFPHFAIVPTDGFRVELGGRVSSGQELFLQEQDAYNLAYQKIFQKNDHYNFVGGDAATPFIISILTCDDVQGGCRAIVRTKFRDHHIIVPNQTPIKMARHALQICRKSDSAIPDNPKLVISQIKGSFMVKDLSNFEDKIYKSKHKMGILYCRGGQTTEEEMFSNTEPSPEFVEFLDMIAERVTLRGFGKFIGGLDAKGDMTGTESYFTTFENLEIMFHVSTMLPYVPDRAVQVERKKHIGNDVVCIVFMDSPTPFKPNAITSKFIHVIIVVQFLERNSENKPIYRVSVASKPGVDPHHPILPTPPHFEGGEDFRKFVLTKAVNSERAAAHAPSFKLTRTRMNALSTIVEKHMEEAPPKKGCFG